VSGITAVGLDPVANQLRAAGKAIADQTDANTAVADFIAARSRPALPHRTGALAASMTTRATPTDAVVSVRVRYAVPALFGAPRAGTRPAASNPIKVALDTQTEWVTEYDKAAAAACNLVKG
jgi:phage gpG-like protein